MSEVAQKKGLIVHRRGDRGVSAAIGACEDTEEAAPDKAKLRDLPGSFSKIPACPLRLRNLAAMFAADMNLSRRTLFLLFALLCAGKPPAVRAQQAGLPASSAAIPAANYNALILQQIRAMPSAGGYSAGHAATQRLMAAMAVDPAGLSVEPGQAIPSYCSGATYLVFLKTVGALHRLGEAPLDEQAMRSLLVAGQRDGEGVWGRWNANGPGTARLFYEMGLGVNFSDFAEARPGDFMKIFWSNAVGKHEHGHSVVFLGEQNINGIDSVRFWSSNVGVGYSEKVVPRKKISAAIFSRLTAPRNLMRAPSFQSTTDPYLGSLLSRDSSLPEAFRECGM